MPKYRISLDEIHKRDKGVCAICLLPVRKADATRDHRVPKSLGGTESADNLILAHYWCNEEKMNKKLKLSPAAVKWLTPEEVDDYENGRIKAWTLARKVKV